MACCRCSKTAKRIAVIGGYANIGVMSGGGSSQVAPQSGPALTIPTTMTADDWQAVVLHPGSPVKAIAARAPQARVSPSTPAPIPPLPRRAPRTPMSSIVFATQWTTEGLDVPDLSLPQRAGRADRGGGGRQSRTPSWCWKPAGRC